MDKQNVWNLTVENFTLYRSVHCFDTLPQKSALSGRQSAQVDFETRIAKTDWCADKAMADATDKAVTGHVRQKVEGGVHSCDIIDNSALDRHRQNLTNRVGDNPAGYALSFGLSLLSIIH